MKKILLILIISINSLSAGYEDYSCGCPDGSYLDEIIYSGISSGVQEGCVGNGYYTTKIPGNTQYKYYHTICTTVNPCDVNQTQDITVYPPVCVDNNPPPLECPANSQPDANNTRCICNAPYIEDSATQSCILPPNVPDDNSTKPNGDCEAGFAKNQFGVCKQDSDGDNVPDDEDAYPNDPTKSGGDSENGGGFCKKNVNDCTPNCVCPAGTYDLVGFTSICFDTAAGTTHPGKYCGVDGDGEEPTEPTPCNYPTPEYFGFKFQTVTSDIFKCVDLQFRYAGGAGENYNCPDTSVACYYNRTSDNNNTDNPNNPPPDTNGTTSTGDLNNTTLPTDANGTGLSDTKNIEDKLDAIKQSIENNNNHSDLISISDSIQGASNINHYDITKLNSDLGSKLDNINNSIKNIPVSESTDMTETNQKLDDLKESIDDLTDESDLPDEELDHNAEISSKTSELSDGLLSYVSNYAPVITFNMPTGQCNDFTFNMPIGGQQTIKINEHIDKLNVFWFLLKNCG